jgi:hypothetical protein
LVGGTTVNARTRNTISWPIAFSVFNLLVALQIYIPLSIVDTLVSVRLLEIMFCLKPNPNLCCLVFTISRDTLYRPVGRELKPFDHVMFGVGLPLALHVKVTSCPSSVVIDDGFFNILEPSKKASLKVINIFL